MQRFLLKVALHLLITLGGIALAYFAYAQRFPLKENYYAAADDKERILATTPAPRIIIVGGSSVAFGIDAELIGKRCQLRPVNMGVQVAFGLPFMLSQVEQRVQAGDVVVLALEYNSFAQYFQADSDLLGSVIERNPLFLTRLKWPEMKAVLDRGFVTRIGTVLRAAVGGTAKGTELSDAIYHRRAFNQFGDLVSYVGQKGKGPMGTRFKYQAGSAAEAIARLNQFHQHCRERGAEVYLSHPPFYDAIFRQSTNSIAVLENELRSSVTIPYLEKPEDTVFEAKDFFDTAYHLNPDGRTKRSEQLAERLLARRALLPAKDERP